VGEAIFVREIGGPEVLRLEAHDPGEPGPDAVRVRVAAAGVNFIDIYFRTGVYPRPLPFVCGLEGAGVVETAGPGVSQLAPGDRVAWAGVPGSYASHLVAPADRVVAIPAGVADDVAAASMLQGMTAHYLAHGCRETRPGDVALVHAAAGGTGLLLVQTLAQAGATVIGTCSTEEKAALARDAGADHVIRYSEEDFAEAVQRLTDGRGVDVAYDSVGQSTFEGSLRSLRPRGLLVLFGQSSGVVPPLLPLRHPAFSRALHPGSNRAREARRGRPSRRRRRGARDPHRCGVSPHARRRRPARPRIPRHRRQAAATARLTSSPG